MLICFCSVPFSVALAFFISLLLFLSFLFFFFFQAEDGIRDLTVTGVQTCALPIYRGHGGADPPIVLFHYAPGRGKEHPLKFLAGYRGRFLQCDAYQSYNEIGRASCRERV